MALISLGEWIDRHGDEPDLGAPEPSESHELAVKGDVRDRRIERWHMLPLVDFLRRRKRLRARHGVHIDLSSGCEIAGTRTRLL